MVGIGPGWRIWRSILELCMWQKKKNVRRLSSQPEELSDNTFIDYCPITHNSHGMSLKNSLGEYYRLVSNPNAWLVELANIKQGRTEGIQDYMQRVVRLVESAYVWVDERNEVIAKQVLGFFIEGLKDQDIKMAVMKEEPQTLDAAY